ncbi:BamA/TamA family outer membrane protein [Desertivirga brevis]|uniref:BamA/TamA family outer membrane protein n=1 Tax=Desertivirga brevis TaxID=2810310 RepID=UPI001A96B654|nr:BamA/TamA family outer membrane protein [Pedobacter sp. SYSU D00873]
MKNKIFLAFILLLSATDSFSQRKLAEKLLAQGDSSGRKGYFLPLPAVAYSQETGWQFGLVTLTSFYTDKADTLTRNSTISGLASITTKKQTHFALKPDIWSPGNKYHYTADIKYRNFPFNFYGIGNDTRKSNEDVITQKLFRVGGEVEKKLKPGIYTGATLNYEHYSYTDKEEGGLYSNNLALHDKDGGDVLFAGLSQIIDSRNTNTYTTRGTYIKVNYSFAPDFFGGANFTGSLFKVDFRTFKSYNPKATLGFNLNYQTLQGSRPPFYLLPQLGNDQVMRGYYTGRYRDQNLLAAQSEFRYRFIPRIGAAAFLGYGTVYAINGFSLSSLKPSVGAGLRYFISPKGGTTLRLDYAFGEKRADEKRQQGFYLSFGEAF